MNTFKLVSLYDYFMDKNPFFYQHEINMWINYYVNARYMKPDKSGKYELTVEMTGRKVFYCNLIMSLINLLIFILYGI